MIGNLWNWIVGLATRIKNNIFPTARLAEKSGFDLSKVTDAELDAVTVYWKPFGFTYLASVIDHVFSDPVRGWKRLSLPSFWESMTNTCKELAEGVILFVKAVLTLLVGLLALVLYPVWLLISLIVRAPFQHVYREVGIDIKAMERIRQSKRRQGSVW